VSNDRLGVSGTLALIIKPLPTGRDAYGRDATQRLRLALKQLLHDYGLRCVWIPLDIAQRSASNIDD